MHHSVESRPDLVIPPAQQLFHSEANHLQHEHRIEAELNRIFAEQWGPGWNYDPASESVDVFHAADLPEHVDALIALGFALVRIHAHSNVSAYCSCTTHWSRQ